MRVSPFCGFCIVLSGLALAAGALWIREHVGVNEGRAVAVVAVALAMAGVKMISWEK